MLHAGLDLSRRRLDVCLLSEHGELVARTAAPPDVDRQSAWGIKPYRGLMSALEVRDEVEIVVEAYRKSEQPSD